VSLLWFDLKNKVPSFTHLDTKDEFFFASCCFLRAAVYEKNYLIFFVIRN
jgi:hypothetical protein